jgi:hypothetical protein
MAREVIGSEGEIKWMARNLPEVTRIRALGWKPRIDLKLASPKFTDGLRKFVICNVSLQGFSAQKLNKSCET